MAGSSVPAGKPDLFVELPNGLQRGAGSYVFQELLSRQASRPVYQQAGGKHKLFKTGDMWYIDDEGAAASGWRQGFIRGKAADAEAGPEAATEWKYNCGSSGNWIDDLQITVRVEEPPFIHHFLLIGPGIGGSAGIYSNQDKQPRNGYPVWSRKRDNTLRQLSVEDHFIFMGTDGMWYLSRSLDQANVIMRSVQHGRASGPEAPARWQTKRDGNWVDAEGLAFQAVPDQVWAVFEEDSQKAARVPDLEAQLCKALGRSLAEGPVGDSLAWYDAVMLIREFRHAYNRKEGWRVKCRETFKLNDKIKGVRVIPLGPFNTGKTWLLSRLCGAGMELPSGVNVHTAGLSIKAALADNFSIILLDTIGSNSPLGSAVLPHLDEGAEPMTRDQVADMLEELRLQEDFYRQLAFEVGQVIIMVVGQMSQKDQSDLVLLARDIHKGKQRKDIVVVHNLREWSRQQLLKKAEDGRNYMQRNKDIFGLDDVEMEVSIGDKKKMIHRHKGLFVETGSSSDPIQITHYYLTNDHLPCTENAFTIQDMRSVITNQGPRNAPLGEELAFAATKIQSRFARFEGAQEPQIGFDDHNKRFVAAEDVNVFVKPRSWGSYFSMGPEEVVFNVTAVQGTTKGGDVDDEEEEEDTDGTKTRLLKVLQVELAGLSATSFAQIKKEIKSGAALKKESPIHGGDKVVLVKFEAELFNLPEHFTLEVQKALNETYKKHPRELQVDTLTQEVTEEGRRPKFELGKRTTRVTLWTNLTDYDASWKPIVTYLDGVLSIILLDRP